MIGVDLAEGVSDSHGIDDRTTKLSQQAFLPSLFKFMVSRLLLWSRWRVVASLIAVAESCSARHWHRRMIGQNPEVKLVAPRYVKPFVMRHTNDAADAKAARPELRLVKPKPEGPRIVKRGQPDREGLPRLTASAVKFPTSNGA